MTGRIAILLVLAFGAHGPLGCTDVLGVDFDDAQLGGCPCEGDLICVNGECVECGGTDAPCCPGHECDPGSACFGPADQAETCTTSCGFVGVICCEGTCSGGGVCIGGACEPTQSDPDPCGGGDLHFVYIVDEFQCATEKKEFWAYPDLTQACADEQLAGYPGFTLGPVDTEVCDWVCQYTELPQLTGTPIHVCAVSAEGFDVCKASTCPDCVYTDEDPDECTSLD